MKSKAKNVISIESVIVALFSILPIIDSINGVFVNSGNFSLGMIYKGFLIVFLSLCILKDGKLSAKLFVFDALVVCCILISIMLNELPTYKNAIRLEFPAKLLFNLFLFTVLYESLKKRIIFPSSIYKILDANCWMFAGCYLIPYVLGIGNEVYTGGLGFLALFYSQNETSFVILVLFYFTLYKLFDKIQWKTLLQTGSLFLCAMLINTKSCIFACFFGLSIWAIRIFLRRSGKEKIIFLLIIAFGWLVFKNTVIRTIDIFWTRLNALSEHYGGNLSNAFISGRNYKFDMALKAYHENPAPMKLLFGNGFHSSMTVEMDPVDMFFNLGIAGLVLLTICLLVILYKGWKNLQKDEFPIRLLGLFMSIIFLIMTGHVIFMATAGTYFVIICCFDLFFSQLDYITIREGSYVTKRKFV